MRLLTTMLTGMDKDTLRKMVDPRVGVAASNEFFSLAAVKKWLDNNRLQDRRSPQHKLLPPIDEPKIDEAERVKRLDKIRMLKLGIQMKWAGIQKE